MKPSLSEESQKLARSWMQHDAAKLRDYLVATVEDPRINLQSILSRHFILRRLTGGRFGRLMEQEYRFAAVMNWLLPLAGQVGQPEEFASLLHALKRGADNAEGIEVPGFVLQAFAELPRAEEGLVVPNYIESFLANTQSLNAESGLRDPILDTFRKLWNEALAGGGANLATTERGCLSRSGLDVSDASELGGRDRAIPRAASQTAALPPADLSLASCAAGESPLLSVLEPARGS